MKTVTTILSEIGPGTYPCQGTASATTPHVACPKPARWRGILRYERPGTTMTPYVAEWFACDQHAYPIAQHAHCSAVAKDGMTALIEGAEKRFAEAGPLR